MDKRLREFLEAQGMRADASEHDAWRFYHELEGEQRDEADALKRGDAPEAGERSHVVADGPGVTPEQAIAAERKRVSAIRSMADGVDSELVERAIDEGWETGKASQEFLTHVQAKRDEAVSRDSADVPGRDGSRGDQVRALSAGICLAGGLPANSIFAGSEHQERALNDGQRFAGMSVADICREALRIEGIRGVYGTEDIIQRAFSTASLSSAFTNSINAAMSMGWEDAPDSTRAWTEEGEVSNFQQQDDITLEPSSGMSKHPRGGEAEHATISDRNETFRADRYSAQFRYDEQDAIDDNLGVLQNIVDAMVDDAAQIRPRLVYALLLANPTLNEDSTAVFDASHNNLDSLALSIANITTGIQAMASQTDGDRNLNIMPRFLITPQDLWGDARQALNSTEVRRDVDGADNEGTTNPLVGMNIQHISDNYIGTAGVTDPDSGTAYTGSATNWFLAAARRTVRVVFRRGTGRRPQVRSYTLDRGEFGFGWDIKLDIGAYVRDFRGLYQGNS